MVVNAISIAWIAGMESCSGAGLLRALLLKSPTG